MNTINSLYKNICNRFKNADIENYANEAKQIIFKVLNISHTDFLLKGSSSVDSEIAGECLRLAERRVSGTPIQYVIGEWDFMNLTFFVGEGVLIPRPETEILCEYVIEEIKNKHGAVVVDLCSGSGCIGLSIAHSVPDAQVFLVEKSDEALYYLNKNSEQINCKNATVIQGDIFNTDELFAMLPEADVIVSNPPYIKSREIPQLQSEVLKEPEMALDGGEDGLDFYRCLCSQWTKHLKSDGIMALECGEEQAESIECLFKENSFYSKVIRDYNNINRIVTGGKSYVF